MRFLVEFSELSVGTTSVTSNLSAPSRTTLQRRRALIKQRPAHKQTYSPVMECTPSEVEGAEVRNLIN